MKATLKETDTGDPASELERRAQKLAALYEASRDLSIQTRVADLLQTLMERVTKLLGNSSTTVFLYDAETQHVEVAATIGGTLEIGTRFGIDQGMTGRVARTGTSLILDDYQTWEHRIPELAAHGVRAILIVPMTCGGELVGALGVSEYTTDRTYSADDERILSMFAAHAASAIRSVQLLEQARARASELQRDNAERQRIEEALRRSEERYRNLVEEMNDVVFTVGFDGVITYISPALERLSGHKPEELMARPFSEFIHPEDLAELRTSFARVLEGRREPVEFRVFTKNGDVRWVRSSSRRHLEDGVPVGITGSLTDVTERKRAELALQESEARYRLLVEMSPDGIAVHRGGQIVFVNSAGVRLLGARDASDLHLKPILDFVHPDDRPFVLARIRRMLQEQRPGERAEERFVRVDGSVRDVEVVAMPLMYEGAEAVQVVVHDITDRKQAARALAESEERFRMLAEATYEGIFIHDEGSIIDANPAGLAMSGHSYEQVLGMDVLNLVAPESREEVAARLRAGSTERYEAIGLRADGTRYHAELIGRTVPYHDRECSVTAIRDVSDRKQAEEALRASEERYRELVENANDLVYVHDVFGNFVAINRAAERTVGYSREEVAGLNIIDVLAPEDVPRTLELMQAVVEGREAPRDFEADVLTKDGRRLTLEISPRAVMRDGVPVAVQGVARDVTDRRKAAAEIRLLNEALEQRVQERTAELAAANKELEAFGYSVSHDLRGPLRVIEGFSRLLLDEYGQALDETARHYIEGVHGSSRRMAQLIQDLLNLSRITRNAIQRRRIDLAPVARAVAAELRRSQPERDVQFLIAERAPASGDRSMLRIVVENLLGNAWKYTGKHPSARIEFGVTEQDGELVYFVRDDGAGFDMEYVGKLFRPFQRLHLVSEFEGTGIGLATVQRIVQRHGGRVWAEGSVEGGATIYFTLSPGKTA
ncbi:MAG TPA: PAS domain S-box protein [Candidatus Limnocylindrales bacterium]|nr:PAS domain S-box protein [Candidatus Limnocylindrales bacterium]